jgi:RHS repeat-associated protein
MKSAVVLLGRIIMPISLFAQSSVSNLDGLTPEGLQPGSPAGSYALSELDTINLYNGSANVAVPLLNIGGRGEAGYAIIAKYGARWDGMGILNESPCSPGPCWSFSTSGWANWDYSYRPAGIAVRHLGVGSQPVMSNGTVSCTIHQSTLTRIAVGLADGTEVMLVDAATGGRPHVIPATTCAHQGFDRGTIFVSTDGSAMTFIANHSVFDSATGSSVSGDSLTGTLYFRDGRSYNFGRYTIGGYELTAIDAIQDRNGNRTTFAYNVNAPGFQYAFSVTDPLGRLTTVAVGKIFTFSDDPEAGCTPANECIGTYDQIMYSGMAGQPRTITVYRRAHWYDRLTSLRTVIQPSDRDLFGGFASSSTKPFIWALSKIVLPDGHSYRFQYNQYAEIARLDLPTGGRYEFEWGNGPGIDSYNICVGNFEDQKCPVIQAPHYLQPQGVAGQLIAVYRRVKERREYVDGGTSWTRRTVYSVIETANNETVAGDPLGKCGSTTNETFISGSCTKATVKEYDRRGHLSTKEHYFYGAVSKYQTLFPQSGWYPWWLEGREFRTDFLQPSGTMLRRQLQTWQTRAIPTWWFTAAGPQPPIDPRIGVRDMIIDGGKMTRKVFGYASLENTNNVTDLWEYDYGNSGGSQGLLLRQTHTDYLTTYNNPSASVHIRDLVAWEKVYNGTGLLVAQLNHLYDETSLANAQGIVQNAAVASQRGNRTSAKRWRNTDGAWLTTTIGYDIAGNIVNVKNPRGHVQTYTYDDCVGMYAFVSSFTNEASQAATARHDCYTGVITSIKDANQFETMAFYGGIQDGGPADPLDRLSKVIRANGQQITYRYSPDLATVTIRADLDVRGPDASTVGDQLLRSETITDGLGRTVETRVYTASTMYVSTRKDLDGLGRAEKIYNPVEMSEGQTSTNSNGTTNIYDAIGRVVTTIYPDGALESFVWSGESVLYTDPAGKQRRQHVDSLNRITAVTEDAAGQALVSSYAYDALDNLTSVVQGAQVRSFTYNSLKQLRSVTNPEVGQVVSCDGQMVSVCYTYDSAPPNDMLKTRAAGGVVTTLSYDALGRLLTMSYSDGTPQVEYVYDLSQIGCLYSVSNSVARTTYPLYAPDCTILGSSQLVGSQNYPFQYSYNLASLLSGQTYPSGRIVSYHYDRAGRVDRVANGPLSSPNSFATNITYASHGALASMQLGVTATNTGWTESWQYNNRLQPTNISAGTGLLALTYSYCSNGVAVCSTNNGNIARQVITRNSTTWTQNYVDAQGQPAYDAMNRLTRVQEVALAGATSWGETYGYDRYGNRWLSSYPGLPAPNAETPTAPNWYTSNNRIASWEYVDGRGNITAIPFMQRIFAYDAENRQTSATVNGVPAVYAYDGEGQRIKKTVNGVTTTYIYDALGRFAAEYSNESATTGTQYRHIDHLGSTRLVVDANGTPIPSGCHDFRPFGEELLAGTNGRSAPCFPSSSTQGLRFTGKEHDDETRLNFFAGRYYSGTQGRFTSPDTFNPFTDFARNEDGQLETRNYLTNPQHWNRYVYALNNPNSYVDRDGKIPIPAIIGIGWAAYETVSAVYDAYTTFKTLSDRNTSLLEKTVAVGGTTASMLLPGGGYGTAGKILAKDIAEQVMTDASKSKQGLRVIGHYPDYITAAKNLNARFFSVPEKFWKAMSQAQRWTANKKFLDRAMNRKESFLLATPRDKIRRGSDLEREVEYLLEKGYKWTEEGTMLIWTN